MKISDVKKLTTQKRFLYWIKERESIRKKKEAKKSKPWTDDEIFVTYKFCNVRRMDDRVSQWLLKNWFIPYYDHPNMLTACTLAREINNTDSLEEIGFPNSWRPKRVQKILESRVERGLKVFSGAYMITGTLGGTKIEQVVNKVVTPIHKSKIKLNKNSMQESCTMLLPFAGFSHFISGQVIADMRQSSEGHWSDAKEWAPMGPGSKRGMNRLLGNDKDKPMKQDVFLGFLKDVIELVEKNLPEIALRLEAIDVQNCLCEFDKYSRTIFGEGRPKSKYPGGV